ncbi:hypothetical protein ABVT39_010781 [Epinephelus coioides]
MDLSASHQMIRAVLQNDPSYIFDLRSVTSGALPVPGSTAGPSWCVCQNFAKFRQTWRESALATNLMSACPSYYTWTFIY